MARLGDLRLELATLDRPNGIVNHSAQDRHTTGWGYFHTAFTPPVELVYQAELNPQFDGQTLAGAWLDSHGNARAIGYRVGIGEFSDPGQQVGNSPACPVAPGDWAGFAVSVAVARYTPASGPYPVMHWAIGYYGPDGAELARTGWTQSEAVSVPEGSTWSTVEISGAAASAAPANTVAARLLFWFGDSDGTGPDDPDPNDTTYWLWHYMTKLYMARGGTQADVTGLTFEAGVPVWVDVLGEVVTMQVKRGGDIDGVTDKLDVGTMTVELRSHTLTPAANDQLRKGRPIRASVYQRWETGPRWEPFYTGTLKTADVHYGDTKLDPSARPHVVLTATDAVEQTQNLAHPYGYSGNWYDSAGALLAAAEYPGPISVINVQNGPGEPVSETVGEIIDRRDDATLYDQLNTITATWPDAHWFVNVDGYLVVSDSETVTGAGGRYFTDTDPGDYQPIVVRASYTAIDVNFGSASHVNVINVRKRGLSERDGEKLYGPYLNQDSVIEWGKSAVEVTVNNGAPRDTAERYLATFGVPQIFARSIDLAIDRDPSRWRDIPGQVDIYCHANVEHGPSGLDTDYQIIGIEHEITPATWYMTLRFRPIITPGTPAVVDPPGGPNTGPSDLVSPAPAPMSLRYRTSAFEVPTGTRTAIPFDQLATGHDYRIPYDEVAAHWILPEDGRYMAAACALWAPNNAGNRYMYVVVNSEAVMRTGGESIPAGPHASQIATPFYAHKGDFVQVLVWQGSGEPLNVQGGGNYTAASITYLDW